jgi:hypothetical protein
VLIRQFFKENRITITIATFFLIMQLTNWPPLRFWGWWGGGNFLDSWQVLASADCYRSIGLQVYDLDNPCMSYAYGRPLLWTLSGLHIGASQASLFGIAFLLIISLAITTTVKNLGFSSAKKNLLSFVIAASPPVLLLVDRGNFDSLIVSMVLLAAWMHSKEKSIPAIILIFLASTFKYYTAPLLLLMVFVSKGKISKATAAILFVAASLSVVRDLNITQFTFSSNNPHLTFGLGHEFLYLLKYDSLSWLEDFTSVTGVLVVLFFSGISYWWLKKYNIEINSSKEKSFMRKLYLFSTTIFISCYLAGMNADYRLIFLCISGIALLNIIRISESFESGALHIICGILWLTFPSGDLEIFGDVLISLYVGFTFALITKLITEKKLVALLK